MTYVIEPSAFGPGYSIFRLKVKDGKTAKVYIADACSVSEAETLCPGATSIVCPAEEKDKSERLNRSVYVAK